MFTLEKIKIKIRTFGAPGIYSSVVQTIILFCLFLYTEPFRSGMRLLVTIFNSSGSEKDTYGGV